MTKAEQEERMREMFALIREYEESNISARAFYNQHNLPEHIFIIGGEKIEKPTVLLRRDFFRWRLASRFCHLRMKIEVVYISNIPMGFRSPWINQ